MLVGGAGLVCPAPPDAVVLYVPDVIVWAAVRTVDSCHQPPDGGEAAVSENTYVPPRSELSPMPVAVVESVTPNNV